jgi:hypothetical protein
VSDRTYAPDAESTAAGFPRAALPDNPNEEMRLAEWANAVCRGCGVAIFVRADGECVCTRCTRENDDPLPPNSAALFPEVVTWTDEQLIIAIELADRREPGLNLYAVGDRPDRHEAFLGACSGGDGQAIGAAGGAGGGVKRVRPHD